MVVQDWQQVECPNFLKGTYMASAYLNDVSITVSVMKVLITFNDSNVTMYTFYQRFNLASKNVHDPCVF